MFIDGARVVLSPKEYRLLQVLAQHAGNVVTHNILMQVVWARATCKTRTTLHSGAEIAPQDQRDPKQPRILVSELGVGYRLASGALSWIDGYRRTATTFSLPKCYAMPLLSYAPRYGH